MRRAWLAWLVFGICASCLLAIMGWGSRKLIELDTNEKKARQQAALEENVRLALWRMETALTPVIVQENSRPYAAYTSAARTSAYVKARYQVDAQRGSSEFSALRAAIPKNWVRDEQVAAPVVVAKAGEPAPPAVQQVQQAAPVQTQALVPQSQMARNAQEFEIRGMMNTQNALLLPQASLPARGKAARPVPVSVRTGVMTPVWAGDELLLARHVQVGSHEMMQVCSLDWPQVRGALLGSIQDLLPGSDLVAERGAFDPAEGRTLTSLPLRLAPGHVPGSGGEDPSPLVFSLKIAWACVAVAILAVGLLLMGAISLSQRRAAFVSSVTHELRSPLTTFRMYTEMLVEGMAPDAAKQSQYHQVLYREADRLVHLVENVLAYARLERGRYGNRESLPIGGLIEHMRERLAEHARLAEMELVVKIEPPASDMTVRVDVSAVERILFNLVDNACKYARSAADRRIHLDATHEGKWAWITVSDHGPGFGDRGTRRLFQPFRKTVNEAARTAPGIGIGLSLSRRLARAAGGQLVVAECSEGACLRLELPVTVEAG